MYLKGSVNFFWTYPGMYVPRPLEFTTYRAETPVEQLAREMRSLSKLNWHNTQFDGGEPITARAAGRVGDILKCVADGGRSTPTFRFYMSSFRRRSRRLRSARGRCQTQRLPWAGDFKKLHSADRLRSPRRGGLRFRAGSSGDEQSRTRTLLIGQFLTV